jgi:hypothetical protein
MLEQEKVDILQYLSRFKDSKDKAFEFGTEIGDMRFQAIIPFLIKYKLIDGKLTKSGKYKIYGNLHQPNKETIDELINKVENGII